MVKANKGRHTKKLACCEYLDKENRFTAQAGDTFVDGLWKATVVNVIIEGRKVFYTLDTQSGRLYCAPSSGFYGVKIVRKPELD